MGRMKDVGLAMQEAAQRGGWCARVCGSCPACRAAFDQLEREIETHAHAMLQLRVRANVADSQAARQASQFRSPVAAATVAAGEPVHRQATGVQGQPSTEVGTAPASQLPEMSYVRRTLAIAAVRDRIDRTTRKGEWMVRDGRRAVLRFVHEADALEFARLTGLVAAPMTPEVAAEDWSWQYPCPRCGFQHRKENDRAACSRREDE